MCGPAYGFTQWGGIDRVTTPSIAGAANCLTGLNAWTAAASGLGTIHTADMEALAPGQLGSVTTLEPGVTMALLGGGSTGALHVRTTTPSDPKYGFNTTATGAQHVEIIQSDTHIVQQPMVRFTFAQPIQAFSFLMTGEGAVSSFAGGFGPTTGWTGGSTDPTFGPGDGGVSPFWPSADQPNARFAGFVDPGASVTSILIELKYMSYGTHSTGTFSIDDIRWVPSPVPGPGVVTLAIIGAPMVAKRRLRPISLTPASQQ
jgi:hypothetical protein